MKNNPKNRILSTYLLQSQQGQLFATHILIDFLKVLRDLTCFNSVRTISHIFSPRYEMLSVPW